MGEAQQNLRKAVAFAIASSSKQEVIEYCIPQPVVIGGVDTGLAVIDLRNLFWDYKQWVKILEKYPYSHYEKPHPLTIRADWLFTVLVDTASTSSNDAHYRLLYNNEKLTRDQFITFWGGNKDTAVHYGIPEGNSGVSVQKKRWILNVGTNKRTYLWQTLDFLAINVLTDPLANLKYPIEGRFIVAKVVHNGEELIVGMPKFSLKTGEFGSLQAYLLANGAGVRVEEAPGTLVKQTKYFRGYGAITNFGGCIECHKTGLNPTTTNEYVEYLRIEPSGDYASAQAKYRDKLEIDRFNLRSPASDIKHDNGLYTIGVNICNGLTPTDNVNVVKNTFAVYDTPVSREQAALELGTTSEELRLAMGYHSATVKFDQLNLNPRFAVLGKGGAIPRSTWEEIYTGTYFAINRWVKSTTK